MVLTVRGDLEEGVLVLASVSCGWGDRHINLFDLLATVRMPAATKRRAHHQSLKTITEFSAGGGMKASTLVGHTGTLRASSRGGRIRSHDSQS